MYYKLSTEIFSSTNSKHLKHRGFILCIEHDTCSYNKLALLTYFGITYQCSAFYLDILFCIYRIFGSSTSFIYVFDYKSDDERLCLEKRVA